jgi:hypothetical protein
MTKEGTMDRTPWRLFALIAFGFLVGPLAADSGEADRLLRLGFPDRDYTGSPIKMVVAGHQCVLAASAWKFDADGGAMLTDAAVVRVTGREGHEIIEAIEGKSARVTFDRPVKKAEELGKSKIVSVETSDGRVIRLAPR